VPNSTDSKNSDYENLVRHIRKVLSKIPPRPTDEKSEQAAKREKE
jgi:hypothetical protein